MRRKRFLVLVGVALAVAVIVPAAVELHAYRQKLARGRLIDRDHFDRITEGMSRAEVEDILGGPPGDFRTKPVEYSHTCALPLDFECDGGRWEWWTGDDGRIELLFDRQDKMRFGFIATGSAPPSLAEWVRIWLRRLWP
jgi:hypothetical protein